MTAKNVGTVVKFVGHMFGKFVVIGICSTIISAEVGDVIRTFMSRD
jgi:hypothetical protein